MWRKTGFDDRENPIMGEAEEEQPHCGMFISFSGRDTRKYSKLPNCQIAKIAKFLNFLQ